MALPPNHDEDELAVRIPGTVMGIEEEEFLAQNENVYIFTDGSSANRKGTVVGGWACILLYNGKMREYSGHELHATNQRMELVAIREGLKKLKPGRLPVVVVSDSQYSINCIVTWYDKWVKNGWRNSSGKPVSNRELVEEVVAIRKSHGSRIRFRWVKGHNGAMYNCRADRLCGEARAELEKQILVEQEKAREEAVEQQPPPPPRARVRVRMVTPPVLPATTPRVRVRKI